MVEEYNPLDYENLTRNCVQELMRRGPYDLPLSQPFAGSGVYALFYKGDLSFYAGARSPDARKPIYVGKAVPPGARKGSAAAGQSRALYGRIREHERSIQAAKNLSLEDFLCRYLVVTPLWITMAERFLIEHYKPIWNVHIDGFGNHPPGRGRPAGEISWWDALHPGREWAQALRQARSPDQAEHRVQDYFKLLETQPEAISRLVERAIERDVYEDDT